MRNLVPRVMATYPEISYKDFDPAGGTIEVVSDPLSDRISKWDHPTLPRPTEQQLLDAEPLPPLKTVFTSREFLRRFTRDEYRAARTHENLDVQFCLDDLIAAQFVDLNDPDVAAGIGLLLSEGVITSERRDDLLRPDPIPDAADHGAIENVI